MPRKFKLTLSLLFLPFCNLIAQTSTEINKTELFICDEKYAESAAIYDNFLSEKVELFNQDYYNAALCHIKLDNFEAAKKHLYKLASLGVRVDDLSVLSQFVDDYNWERFKVTYRQIANYSDKNNEYTDFELKIRAMQDQIATLSIPMNKFSSGYEVMSNGVMKISFLDIRPKVDSSNKQSMQDSLNNLLELKTLLINIRKANDELSELFIDFLSTRPWPKESESNSKSLVSKDNFYLKTAKSIYRGSEQVKAGIVFENSFLKDIYQPEDSVKNIQRGQKIKSILLKASNEERLKAIDVLPVLNSGRKMAYSPFKAMRFFIREAGCDDYGEGIYFEPVSNKYTSDIAFLNLESRTDYGKKYIYQALNPGEFMFNCNSQIEHAYFESCESAKKYIESKGLIKKM